MKMDGKWVECIFLILSSFMVLTASSSRDTAANEGSQPAAYPSTTYNPVNIITINSTCSKNEDDGQLKEYIRGIENLLSDLITRMESGEFCCEETVEEVEEETGEEIVEEIVEDKILTDCYEIQLSGKTASGVYQIQPNDYADPFDVYCDMDTDDGGWTVFQRREDGSINFYRVWEVYKLGFGSVDGEHWLGNDKLHYLSNQKAYELRVDLADFDDATRYAVYDNFLLADESDYYRLTLGAFLAGDAGNGMENDNGQQFSTYDADHDSYEGTNCAELYSGAWWYLSCHTANLNGQYLGGEHSSLADGVEWNNWRGYYYSLKFTEMKIRPHNRQT